MRLHRQPARVLLAAALLLVAPHVTYAAQDYSPDPSPPERVELTGVVEVSITLESNLPIVEARVNGNGPFRFGIETGANFVVISPELPELVR
jgi:hypothetical protein